MKLQVLWVQTNEGKWHRLFHEVRLFAGNLRPHWGGSLDHRFTNKKPVDHQAPLQINLNWFH